MRDAEERPAGSSASCADEVSAFDITSGNHAVESCDYLLKTAPLFQSRYIRAVRRHVCLRRGDICSRGSNIGDSRMVGLYCFVYILLRYGMFLAQWPVAFLDEAC